MKSVEQLTALNAAVIAQILPRLRLRTLTVDVHGVVVPTLAGTPYGPYNSL